MIKRHVGLHRRIERVRSLQKGVGIHPVQLGRKLFQRVGGDFGHKLDAVLVAQQTFDLAIKYLPGKLTGLLEHFAAVTGVGKRMKIKPLIDEALAIGIDQQTKNVAVFLKFIADIDVTKFRCVTVPAGRVATRPVSVRRSADV